MRRISEDSHVVIYDLANGGNAAARCWWMLRAFGLEKVQVLSGGFQKAEKLGITTNSGEEYSIKTGIIILQLRKDVPDFNEVVLDFSNKQHLDLINHCENTFLSLTYSYYHILEAERLYKLL